MSNTENNASQKINKSIARIQIIKDADGVEVTISPTVEAMNLPVGTHELFVGQQQEEPVGWAFQYADGSFKDFSTTKHFSGMVPLYARPTTALGTKETP